MSSQFVSRNSIVSEPQRRIALGVILGIAALTRLISLSAHSLLIDEAFTAISARDIALNHTPVWDATSNAIHSGLVAQFILLFGTDAEWVCRLPSAIAGIVVVGLIYKLARKWCVEGVALSVAALAAVHPFLVAFSRLCFIDIIQTAAILAAILAMEQIARPNSSERVSKWRVLPLFVWLCLGFALKFNAPFFIFIWIASAALTQIYTLRQAAFFAVLQSAAIALALIVSPFGLLPWFASFVSHAGSENLPALQFFQLHLSNLDLHLSALVVVMTIIAVLRSWNGHRRTFQVLVFVLLSLAGLVILGRTFQRYLLTLTPFITYLLVVSFYNGILYVRQSSYPNPWQRRVLAAMVGVLLVIGLMQYSRESLQYIRFLRNDADFRNAAGTVRAEMSHGAAALWMLPETVGAYYLGFDRYYSRALDSMTGEKQNIARRTYFENSATAFGEPLPIYRTLQARMQMKRWGVFRSVSNSTVFLDSLGEKTPPAPVAPRPIAPGDILLTVEGLRSSGGEPVLIPYDPLYYPPLPSMPDTSGFDIVKVYSSAIESSAPDALRVWVLRKR